MKNKFKVLIGDDTLNFGIICGELLEKREFETVVTPKDGIKVFEAIQSTHPEVVIMDSSMPHIDALGILKSFSAENINPPYFIVTSAYDNPQVEKELLNNGASYFVLKPLDLNMLCDRVEMLARKIRYAGSQTKCHQNGRFGNTGYRGDSSNRRSGTHQGLSLFARSHHPIHSGQRND